MIQTYQCRHYKGHYEEQHFPPFFSENKHAHSTHWWHFHRKNPWPTTRHTDEHPQSHSNFFTLLREPLSDWRPIGPNEKRSWKHQVQRGSVGENRSRESDGFLCGQHMGSLVLQNLGFILLMAEIPNNHLGCKSIRTFERNPTWKQVILRGAAPCSALPELESCLELQAVGLLVK